MRKRMRYWKNSVILEQQGTVEIYESEWVEEKWEKALITNDKVDREEKRNGRLWNDHNGNENPRKTDITANVPCANIKR